MATDQELTSCCFAPAPLWPVAGSSSNTNDDHREQNLFANVISNNSSVFEEPVPNQTSLVLHHHEDYFPDYSRIGPLSSSDLQEIESMRINEQNYNQGTNWSRGLDLLADVVVLEEVDDGVEKYSIDLNTLDYGWLNEQLQGEYVIDMNTSVLSDSEQVEQHRSTTDVVGLDNHDVVVIDLDTSSSSGSEETEHDHMEYYGNTRGETSHEPDENDHKQMHVVNESTTVDDHMNNSLGGITLTDLQQQSGKKINDAAASLGVSRSTFKRICRTNGIARWSHKRIVQQPATATLTKSIGVKVSYNDENVRFPLSLSSGKKDLEVEVEKRFGIKTGSFWIKYEDEDKDWILITCDEDLHHGIHTCMERGITTMKMHVG